MSRDPRIDLYIEGAAPFARPILEHLRGLVHAACPEVEEAIKWNMPAFLYGGSLLAHMAAFKAHTSFGFWRAPEESAGRDRAGGMGQFGRVRSIADLPSPDRLEAMVRSAAAALGQRGKRKREPAKPDLPCPDDLAQALTKNAAAADKFAALPTGARREYVEWIVGAKRVDTRNRRIADAVQWIAEGKRRNWKYERC